MFNPINTCNIYSLINNLGYCMTSNSYQITDKFVSEIMWNKLHKFDGVVKSLHLLRYSVCSDARHTTCMPSPLSKHYALLKQSGNPVFNGVYGPFYLAIGFTFYGFIKNWKTVSLNFKNKHVCSFKDKIFIAWMKTPYLRKNEIKKSFFQERAIQIILQTLSILSKIELKSEKIIYNRQITYFYNSFT